ncbi:Zinc resistance conferring protein [Entomophthora muscae]|uniref:Zinc resistance conferring protein n=1 Tax=Entomophthora muscae TaxID=34485 RepID=A0ACC2TXH1_9FUNG|nr:Zinc resistance conferring protein [Entomophthora muscae]
MGLSKSTKLYIQLTLSIALFFAELLIGYAVNSIALIADAFHMLNDVVSLVIAVYAVKLAQDTKYNPKYSYGLQRAEVLGALINAVLLLGLCLSIVAEAIPRFFDPKEIQSPQLILIVGTIGLLFNLLGVFLFGHHHGHDHGHDHSHSHDVETGHSYEQFNDSLLSPALFQQSIIATARQVSESRRYEDDDENSALLTVDKNQIVPNDGSHNSSSTRNHDHGHHNHDHGHDHGHNHGHDHGDGALNMRGVYLHVLGDAMASLAVIFSSLIIWKTDFESRFLLDPAISIVITLLIIRFTVPLIKSASIILLQGVPSSVPLDEVRTKVLALDGVVGIHELHIWQLSDTKAVASVHIIIDSPHHANFVKVATRIKQLLHFYNVHSVTIQPEYSFDSSSGHAEPGSPPNASCLLACQAECAPAQCCPPGAESS